MLLRDEEVAGSKPVARAPERPGQSVIDQAVVVVADGMTTDQPRGDPLPLPHGRSVAAACSIRRQLRPHQQQRSEHAADHTHRHPPHDTAEVHGDQHAASGNEPDDR